MISVLFAARNSVYKTLPGVDVWDEDRNALNWPGGNACVAHPPCRLWSGLKERSKAPESEKGLAVWAIEQVRKWGGVLEHPAASDLWIHSRLPLPGTRDAYGISISVYQWWFGHKVRKATWLYICGATELPSIPFKLGEPIHRWDNRNSNKLPHLLKSERSATPIEFAKWLIQLAEQCKTK